MARELKPSETPKRTVKASSAAKRRALAGLAVVQTASRNRKAIQPIATDDALFALLGIGASTVAGGVSGRKHEYLAETQQKHHS